jgi:hypothetical protein
LATENPEDTEIEQKGELSERIVAAVILQIKAVATLPEVATAR